MIMKKLAFATLVAMGMTAAAIAQQQPGQGPSPSQRSTQPTQPQTQPRTTQPTQPSQTTPRGGDRTEQVTFERADKDADGRVSREEGNDVDGFDFSRADTNNDGSLSRQEYQAAMATSTPRGDGAQGPRSGDRTAWLEFVLDEGRNRQIRRLLAAFDFEVLRLVRVAIGSLELGDLAKGAWRPLTPDEVAALGGDRSSAG
jgi:hypothetical protein